MGVALDGAGEQPVGPVTGVLLVGTGTVGPAQSFCTNAPGRRSPNVASLASNSWRRCWWAEVSDGAGMSASLAVSGYHSQTFRHPHGLSAGNIRPDAAKAFSSRRERCLAIIDERVPLEVDIHLVLDNFGTHKTAMI